MKRAKIMLAAITVLAVVGGALAFKARTVGAFNICTTDVSGACPDVPSLVASTASLVNTPTFYFTTIPNDAKCKDFACTTGADVLGD